MSPHPMNSIWLRLSIVSLSNPTNYPMLSKGIYLLQLPSALRTDVLRMSIFKWPKVMSKLEFILEGLSETYRPKVSLTALPAGPH